MSINIIEYIFTLWYLLNIYANIFAKYIFIIKKREAFMFLFFYTFFYVMDMTSGSLTEQQWQQWQQNFQPTFQPAPMPPVPQVSFAKTQNREEQETKITTWKQSGWFFSVIFWILLLVISFLLYFQQFDLFWIVFDYIQFALLPLCVFIWAVLLLRQTKVGRFVGWFLSLWVVWLTVMIVLSFEQPQHRAPMSLMLEEVPMSFVMRWFLTDISLSHGSSFWAEWLASATNDRKTTYDQTKLMRNEESSLSAKKPLLWSVDMKVHPNIQSLSLYSLVWDKNIDLREIKAQNISLAWVYGDTHIVLGAETKNIIIDAWYGNISIEASQDVRVDVSQRQTLLPFSPTEIYSVWNGDRVVTVTAAQFGGTLSVETQATIQLSNEILDIQEWDILDSSIENVSDNEVMTDITLSWTTVVETTGE